MSALERIGAPSAPPPAVMRLLGRYSREELAVFVTVAIDLIDSAGPDPDREEDDPTEADGDEDDGGLAEDEPCASFQFIENGPGCPVANPDCCVTDQPHDADTEDGL
jgi:hypothetical protein